MKDNKEILNEAFFKKRSRKELLNLPQYKPANGKESESFLAVKDIDEVKKNLASTFGVTFGSNTVRSMASKAIKQFPIIVSDNIEPETVVVLKKLMEEQYAEYISLLVSNQVIDLADYSIGDENGNIAIQAVNSLSGGQFGKSKLANKAASGNINAEDVFGDQVLYQILREGNDFKVDSKDEFIDNLINEAVIVPSEYSDKLVEFIKNNCAEMTLLEDEPSSYVPSGAPTFRKDIDNKNENENTLQFYMMKNMSDAEIEKYEKNLEARRGYSNGKLNKITSADIVIDPKSMDDAINKSVGQFLTDEKNFEIRDRFEKATFLLQSRRIAGIEYYNYLTLRLGIPVSDAARTKLIHNFKIGDVVSSTLGQISDEDISLISKNERVVKGIVTEICKPSLKKALLSGALGGVGGAILSLGIATPLLPLFIVSGVAVGSSAYLINALLKKKKDESERTYKTYKIEGWERVEDLINEMNKRQSEIRKSPAHSLELSSYEKGLKTDDTDVDISNTIKVYNDNLRMIKSVLTETSTFDPNYGFFSYRELPQATCENAERLMEEVLEECENDKEYRAERLVEATLYKGTSPVEVRYVDKKPGKDVLITPSSISTRTNYAYGSTEIERRDNKDRRYDQPLVMTVKFKERFSDGKFSDNELTAVIGILGKVIRVPSAEMEYVLESNLEGNTIENFLKTGDIKNAVSDLFGFKSISKDLKNMPQSGDIWHNLEKVSALAAANKISGRRNNNLANAHIIFSQKEIDDVRSRTGVDYSRDAKKAVALMKRYSALTIMIANDPGQRAYIFDDQDNISWNVVPYSALMSKDSGDQLTAALAKLTRR